MKYKKFKFWTIVPGWISFFFKILTGLFVIFAIMWAVSFFIFATAKTYGPYDLDRHLIDIPYHYEVVNVAEIVFFTMFAVMFFLVPLALVFSLFIHGYKAKFYFGKFKLSDIKNPEKYDPNDIRKYFPEYRSKKEKMESNNKNEQINQKEQ